MEDSAKKQIVDASYSACKHFTGSTSCGWSDRITVTCVKTSYTMDHIDEIFPANGEVALGPCSYNTTYAKLAGVPSCGRDTDLFLNEN